MRIRYASIISLVLAGPLAASLTASLDAQVTNEAASIEGGSYKADPSHTLVRFEVDHFGFSPFFGVFPAATGTLILDQRSVGEAKIDVSVPVERVSTTNPKLDEELRGADWFDAASHPTIRFVSTRVTRTGPGTAKIEGTITLHGISKPLVLDATFVGSGMNPMSKAYTVGFTATGRLKRAEFGISKYAPLVGDDIALTIAAPFEKAR